MATMIQTVAKDISAILESYVAEGLFTHAFAAYAKVDEKPLIQYTISPDGRDLFDLASLTKALVTTPLVFSLVRKGRISFDDSVGNNLEFYQLEKLHPNLQKLSFRSLLSHCSGLPAWRNFWTQCLEDGDAELPYSIDGRNRLLEGLNRAADALNSEELAQRGVYSDVGFILLGTALEMMEGRDLAQLFDKFCQDELLLNPVTLPLHFAPALAKQDAELLRAKAVPTSYCPVRGRYLLGEVHDENCAALGGVTGHAGCFGTGAALCIYLNKLCQSDIGRMLVMNAEKTHQKPVVNSAQEALLGWRRGDGPAATGFGQGQAIGHLGFTGTAFWFVPEKQAYAILLTNRAISGRMPRRIAACRRDVFSAFGRLLS